MRSPLNLVIPFFCALAAMATGSAAAQDGTLHVVERSDWSSWLDGAYKGHVWREGRATIRPAAGGQDLRNGDWYLLEETLHDLRTEAKALDESGTLKLSIGLLGALSDDGTSPLPSLRGLLDLANATERRGISDPSTVALHGDLLRSGATFVAPGLRIVLLRGVRHAIPFLAQYGIGATGSYAGRKVVAVRAKFATRLSAKDGDLATATGTHDLDIRIDVETGLPLFVRDLFDDSYGYADGGTERRAGSNLVFWSGGDAVGGGELLASVGKILGVAPAASAASPGGAPSAAGTTMPGAAATATPGAVAGAATSGAAASPPPGVGSTGAAANGRASPEPPPSDGLVSSGPGSIEGNGELPAAPSPDAAFAGAGDGIEVGRSEAGLTLRVEDLHFAADSAVLLPSEKGRLDIVARALLAAPEDRSFLVEGHAAAAGKPQGELELSSLRAKAVVDALVSRGIAASRFIWRGLGSLRPLASNDSEAGRARNRRVEITILD